MTNPLEHCPVIIEIPVAWGEMDAYGHVNNIVYLRYFESARIAYFMKLGLTEYREQTGIGPILATIQCRFRIPLTFPDTVRAGARISKIERDRFAIEHYVFSQNHQKIAAEGAGIVVSYDYRANTKAPLPMEIVERIKNLEIVAPEIVIP